MNVCMCTHCTERFWRGDWLDPMVFLWWMDRRGKNGGLVLFLPEGKRLYLQFHMISNVLLLDIVPLQKLHWPLQVHAKRRTDDKNFLPQVSLTNGFSRTCMLSEEKKYILFRTLIRGITPAVFINQRHSHIAICNNKKTGGMVQKRRQ